MIKKNNTQAGNFYQFRKFLCHMKTKTILSLLKKKFRKHAGNFRKGAEIL